MKVRNIFYAGMALCCLFLLSQNAFGQQLVKDVDISEEEAKVQFAAETPSSYFVEIGGPNGYYWKERVDYKNTLTLSNLDHEGNKFEDGQYTLQVTPIIELDEEQRKLLQELRAIDDEEQIRAFRRKNNLPDVVDIYSASFAIRNGKFVTPVEEGTLNLPTYSSRWEMDHPSLYASINPIEMTTPSSLATDNTTTTVDQVINDDLIVTFSLCVGNDCANGESFGFDTIRLKENNLRIKFQDTSNSASFPTNDWQITANDSSNGGQNKFSIDDIDGGRTPFTIEAGAPSHSLYVDDGGRIGLGTSTPVVEVHVKDGDTPTMRLEQDGSSGFTAQTWDVAGNETNFFVRDATNGSRLPFKIRPSAPTNSLFIDTDGDIGLGTDSPEVPLDVAKGNAQIRGRFLRIGKDAGVDETAALIGFGRSQTGPAVVRLYNSWTNFNSWGSSFGLDASGSTTFNHVSAGNLTFTTNSNQSISFVANSTGSTTADIYVDAVNSRVGIGTNSPSNFFHVNSSDAAKVGGGDWIAASDKKLKKEVKPFTDGLDKILAINPVKFKYNGQGGIPDDGKEYVGLIAQEIQKIAPYTVGNFTFEKVEMVEPKEGEFFHSRKVLGTEEFLSVDATAVRYMLVNAVKEQQAMIEAQKAEIESLKAEVASLQELKAQVAELAKLVKGGNATSGEQTGEDK